MGITVELLKRLGEDGGSRWWGGMEGEVMEMFMVVEVKRGVSTEGMEESEVDFSSVAMAL